jgi:septal ring factor EnvC (AmiA/AmiB activator)
MAIVLTDNQRITLSFFYQEYLSDVKMNSSTEIWGFGYSDIDKPLLDAGAIAVTEVKCADGEIEQRSYITQAGADYLGFQTTITTPFDRDLGLVDELTAARAEIARLTAALAESEAARKADNDALADALRISDAGWSEAIDQIDELTQEIKLLKQDSGIPF